MTTRTSLRRSSAGQLKNSNLRGEMSVNMSFGNSLRPTVSQKVVLRATRQSRISILEDKENSSNGQESLSSARAPSSRLRRPLAAVKIIESSKAGGGKFICACFLYSSVLDQ